ncbi:hypothetical protein CDAR_213341 [Caerostris darwini]|uniref:Uncharacterized protein n=1 Tax=Caerostris darwini TaxID=1538125 RepID=A0AAV4PX15_9ARAC|nr:hypothetical protein CDAR_213341 [Caerostris darwini]
MRFLGIDSLAKEEGSIRKRIRIDHCRPNAVLACAERNHWADCYRDLVVFSSCFAIKSKQSEFVCIVINECNFANIVHLHRYFEASDSTINEKELILLIALLKRSASGLHSVDGSKGSKQLEG